ncbi:MAG TPA: DUF2849 domain-containing protein [Novosphingobium sp.]|nr:DUF2849 domain-containing protein [Novosphingobium sp.]HZV10109.1 DUF2849 domain-containing protein [Novosphingobium sp.]
MKIVTGNDLKTGAVIWWTGEGWSLHVNEAAEAAEHAAEIIAREEAARHVVGAYAIEATRDTEGLRPAHIKDRIRALGPTVRLDLSLKPADPDAGNWVI